MTSPQDLLCDLNPEQVEAVLHGEGPLLILAGAGSGKTRVITHRAAYLVRSGQAHPWEILCVTFTNKAAREMRMRIEALLGEQVPMKVSTFHSFGLDLIRQGVHPPEVYSGSTILDEEDQRRVMEGILTELKLDPRILSPQLVLHRIEAWKNAGIPPEKVEERIPFPAADLRELYRAYAQRLRDLRALDFEDLLYLPVQALSSSEELRQRFGERYRFIMVDEYQDTNPVQYRLLRLLCERHRNLVVVGDDDQAIYRWRGADIRNILEFERDFPGARVIRLERNYRSTQVILDAAWSVVRHNRARKEKRLFGERQGGERITVASFLTPRSEAEWVAEEISRKKGSGVQLREMAVFYRINAQSRVLEESLRRRGIPYRIYGGLGFYERKEIKDLLAYLRLMRNPYDLLALERVFSFPRQGIGPATLARIREQGERSGSDLLTAMEQLLREGELTGAPRERLQSFLKRFLPLYEEAHSLPVSRVLEGIVERFQFKEALLKEHGEEVGEDRWENIEELLVSVGQWEESAEDPALARYLDEVVLVQERGAGPGEEAVNLMTLHSAKGLEFHTVFIVGCEEELLPHARSQENREELEEERRLLYVGLTRAKEKVYLSFTRIRPLAKGGERPSYPSRFLEEIPPSYREELKERGSPVMETGLEGLIPGKGRERREGFYFVGERLEHPLFGIGTVVRIEEGSSGVRLVMRFPQGEKTILPRFVAMRRVGKG